MTTGNISINTNNLFPIIKKWLYSDKDIFIRELVSNASDAITKISKLSSLGKADVNDAYSIEVVINKEEKTLSFIDNGIGMTQDEVVKYIAEIAFSGAEEFINKYKEEDDENQIIGHFGLGFYSAFMVADRVDINTLSYAEGAKSVFWTCDGGTTYEITEGTRSARGTEIVLHIGEDSMEFLEEARINAVLNKYCSFLPYPIYMYEAGGEKSTTSINDTHPLWLKNPADCTHDEYNEFYRKVFYDLDDPLFYIHLNVEYPFNLKGILYFPKLKHEFEPSEGQIKLYNNQVFVADNIKEVIPEFLLLLKGCIDCPDLPLNVSRSFLQNDGYVAKISAHITKKVADKLTQIYKNQREDFNKYWDDINPFVKYGCLRDDKFYERVKDIIIYKTIDDRYLSLSDYLDEAKAKNHENTVYYVSDPAQQSAYINLFKNQGVAAVLLPGLIDNHFISFVEQKQQGVKFMRIDSDLASALKGEKVDIDKDNLTALFKEAIANDKIKINLSPLKSDEMPAVLLLSEQSRRMQEMTKMYGGQGMPADMFPEELTLTVNINSPIIKELAKKAEDKKVALPICLQVYDVARLAHKPLDSESLSKFIKRSAEIMEMALK